jgi:hypothetical protein
VKRALLFLLTSVPRRPGSTVGRAPAPVRTHRHSEASRRGTDILLFRWRSAWYVFSPGRVGVAPLPQWTDGSRHGCLWNARVHPPLLADANFLQTTTGPTLRYTGFAVCRLRADRMGPPDSWSLRLMESPSGAHVDGRRVAESAPPRSLLSEATIIVPFQPS